MSNEIALRTETPLAEKMEWAKAMATGTMLPRAFQGNPANLLFAVEYADTLGIPRINALTSIHVIDGKPTASADLIASLVRKAGHKLRVSGDDTFAEATIIRADDPDFSTTVRWDEAKARKAGKWGSKGPWTNYPGAMLRSRAITEVARMAASDALYGVIYTPEELGEVIDEDGKPAPTPRQQQVTQRTTSRPTSIAEALEEIPEPATLDVDSVIDAMAATDDIDGLKAQWEAVKSDLGDRRKEVLDFVTARLLQLRDAEEAAAAPQDEQGTLDAEIVDTEPQQVLA